MNIRDLINKLDTIAEAELSPQQQAQNVLQPGTNKADEHPYANNPAQKALYDKLTPQDQEWATRGGGRPDLSDPFIRARMPNKGKEVAAPAAPAAPAQSAAPAQPETKPVPAIADKVEKLQKLIAQYQDASKAPAQSGVAAKPAATPINISQNSDGTFTLVAKDGKKITFDKEGKVISESQLTMSELLILEMSNPELALPPGVAATDDAVAKAAELASKTAKPAAGAAAKATLAKVGAKAIPGVGVALSANEAYERWMKGDRTGAVISALAGAGWLVPGPMGWMLGGSLEAANYGRDKAREKNESSVDERLGAPVNRMKHDTAPTTAADFQKTDKDTTPVPMPKAEPTGDPKIYALQKYLNTNHGATLKVDGILGPLTRGALQAANLSESQKIELLRLQLEAIEESKLGMAREVIAKGANYADDVYKYGRDVASKLWGKAKQFYQGTQSPNMTPLPNVGQATNVRYKGPSTAFQVGQKVGQNPVKSTAAAAGTAGVVGYASTDSTSSGSAAKPAEPKTAADFQRTDKDTTPVPTPQTNTKPSAPAPSKPAQAAPSAPSVDLESLKKEMAKLVGEIKGSGVSNSVVDSTIKQAEDILQMSVAPIN